MLIDTEVIDAKEMIPLRRTAEALKRLSTDQLESIADQLCAAQEAEYPAPVGRMRAILEQGKVDGDLHTKVLYNALWTGKLSAYALRPTTDSAFRVTTIGWCGAGSLHDTDRSIENGTFAINGEPFGQKSAEREVAGRPLLIRKREADRLLQHRPPSKAQLQRVGLAIVEEFQRENPGEGQKLRKFDFIEKFRKKLPASSRASRLNGVRISPSSHRNSSN